MFDFSGLLDRPEFAPWRNELEEALGQRSNAARHGDLPNWLKTLQQLPNVKPDYINLNADIVQFGDAVGLDADAQQILNQALLDLAPWRKGPYQIFNTFIDTEWRSDWKWQRLAPHISDLKDRKILDVGCGTGYHCWRMLGAGARHVVGIDPSMRFFVQHLALQHYAQDPRFDFLPIGIEDMPAPMAIFESVFSMGVLYHRRQPINHLKELYGLMADGSELVLETLIVDQADNGILTPSSRYAKMRNVWSIMTCEKIIELLRLAGFVNPQCVDQNLTSLDEQRSTQWMQFHSLQQFLDPDDIGKTVEGYPAPKRGIFIAQKQ